MKTLVWYGAPLLIVLGLCVASVLASAKTVNMGERIRGLETKQLTLRQEQKELDEQLASVLSLHSLRQEALAQGYVPMTGIAFVSSLRPVAMRVE